MPRPLRKRRAAHLRQPDTPCTLTISRITLAVRALRARERTQLASPVHRREALDVKALSSLWFGGRHGRDALAGGYLDSSRLLFQILAPSAFAAMPPKKASMAAAIFWSLSFQTSNFGMWTRNCPEAAGV